jgi:hypothetical protein
MQKPKPLHLAHEDLKGSLHELRRAQEGFEDKHSGAEGHIAPNDIARRIEKSADSVDFCVRYLSLIIERVEKDRDLILIQLDNSLLYIDHASTEICQSLHDGTNFILGQDHDPFLFLSWQALCGGVYSFARSAAQELCDLRSKYPPVSDMVLFHGAKILVDASGIMEGTAKEALECRKRGISGHLMMGSLSEYALEDAKAMGKLILDGLIPDMEEGSNMKR